MPKKHPYKPTNVLAVDLVAGCKNFYEKRFRKVVRVYLRPDLWKAFCEYVKRNAPEYEFENEIDFDGTIVQQGALVGTQPMVYYLNQTTEA